MSASEAVLQWVPLAQIVPHPRARAHDPAKLKELAESMAGPLGQLQPCRGRPLDGKIQVYVGEGRRQAAAALDWRTMPVLVGEAMDEEVDLALLHENLKREDLDPLSEAREYDHLVKAYHWSQEKVAEKAGVSQQTVSESIGLLDLPREVLDLTGQPVISKSHLILISKINDPQAQIYLAQQVVANKWTVEKLGSQIRMRKGKAGKIRNGAPSSPNGFTFRLKGPNVVITGSFDRSTSLRDIQDRLGEQHARWMSQAPGMKASTNRAAASGEKAAENAPVLHIPESLPTPAEVRELLKGGRSS